MAKVPVALASQDAYRVCDPASLGFSTTADLPQLDQTIGQARALESVQFGLGMANEGYNIFAAGPAGTGKTTMLSDYLALAASTRPAPDDWLYVHNFATPHKPNAIRMPPGKAQQFRKDMEKLVEDLRTAITQAFESEDYEKQKHAIAQKVSEQQEAKFSALADKAQVGDYGLLRTSSGLAIAPKAKDGEPLSREAFEALPEKERQRIDAELAALNEELQQVMRSVRQDEREGRDSTRELDRQVTTFAAEHLVEELSERWSEIPEIDGYLRAVLADVIDNADEFKSADEQPQAALLALGVSARQKSENAFRRYRVNVVVDNSLLTGAPLVTESSPVLQNLVGRVEHQASFGALFTDFNMIKTGALQKANGGFLVLEATEVLTKPYSWDALKRTLKTGEIRIEDVAQQMGLSTTSSLDPEPIPFKAKVILIGEPFVYYLLYSSDPDFRELFKVKADFSNLAERTPENERLYARFVARLCAQRGLPPVSAEGVARVIEHCSRLVEDQRRLTTRFLDVADLVTEAGYWARAETAPAADIVVQAKHVQSAIDHHLYRSNLIEERLRESITDGTVFVDTSGSVVGQVNGLSVLSMGDHTFGRPSRITATHRLGDGEVLDIEREVEMGGPIHSKGVLIIGGYLGAKYASDSPLSLTARLVFEQSYSGVEGDSASSAELYALLSSLSGAPIQQRFAVTGSVNQRGQIQPIGGVNEKIEGFFDVCLALGHKGDESVIIPKTNVPHLMLAERVRSAMASDRFHIYAVETVDEGISLLTGLPAGSLNAKGQYPAGSVNRLVMERLSVLAEKARETARQKPE